MLCRFFFSLSTCSQDNENCEQGNEANELHLLSIFSANQKMTGLLYEQVASTRASMQLLSFSFFHSTAAFDCIHKALISTFCQQTPTCTLHSVLVFFKSISKTFINLAFILRRNHIDACKDYNVFVCEMRPVDGLDEDSKIEKADADVRGEKCIEKDIECLSFLSSCVVLSRFQAQNVIALQSSRCSVQSINKGI